MRLGHATRSVSLLVVHALIRLSGGTTIEITQALNTFNFEEVNNDKVLHRSNPLCEEPHP